MSTLEEKIEVMQAWVDGKQIQWRKTGCKSWEDLDDPVWNWERNTYRVKPKPREWWLTLDRNGKVAGVYEECPQYIFMPVVKVIEGE